jgi:hypothetical protein
MTSGEAHRNNDLGAVAADDTYVTEQIACPHMVHPERCGLCLREKHFKKIYEGITESEKRLLSGR